MTRESPGFRRMQERLGPDAAEKLRLDTLRQQEEATRVVREPAKDKKKGKRNVQSSK